MRCVITADWLPELLDHTGIAVFAVTGALAAIRKNFDIVGVAVLASVTALGGGVVRDLIIGAVPPAAFHSIGYVLIPLIVTAISFFWHPQLNRIFGMILVLDAAGLGLFCVTGTEKALDYGLSPLHAALLGVATAVGGGIIRDLLSNEIPAVLHDRQFYALPAVVGAAVVAVAWSLGVETPLVTFGAALLAFGLRMLAIRRSWRTPQPRGT